MNRAAVWYVRAAREAVPDHGHNRSDARTTGNQDQRCVKVNIPDEIAPNRAAELDLVADGEDVDQVRRDFSILEPLDREFQLIGSLGRRCDRVRPLGVVSVRSRQADVDVLSRLMARPAGNGKGQRLYARGLFDASGDPAQTPGQSPLYRCSRHGSPYM